MRSVRHLQLRYQNHVRIEYNGDANNNGNNLKADLALNGLLPVKSMPQALDIMVLIAVQI